MQSMGSLLLISNGHGEDVIAAAILENLLQKAKGLRVQVMPIVGEGNAYRSLDVKLLGPLKTLPTGGFMRQNLTNFFRDLKGGLLSQTYEQVRTLLQIKNETNLVVCVGDVLLLILAGFFVRKPLIFIPTAKSEYISGHYGIEKYLMKRFAQLVFPRDKKTAEVLQRSGIQARFVGNAMMDSFQVSGYDFGFRAGARIIGILPGSRLEAYQNLETIFSVIGSLESLRIDLLEYVVALAPQLSVKIIGELAERSGFYLKKSPNVSIAGVVAELENPKGVKVKLCKGIFGDVLEQSEVFVGLAGTANEQAVGMGKPVIAFPTKGAQFNQKFMRAQQKLLGESLAVVEAIPEKIAQEVLMILADEKRYQKMARIGKERMGPQGGILQMADHILEKSLNK